jgi:hypothetical protein
MEILSESFRQIASHLDNHIPRVIGIRNKTRTPRIIGSQVSTYVEKKM